MNKPRHNKVVTAKATGKFAGQFLFIATAIGWLHSLLFVFSIGCYPKDRDPVGLCESLGAQMRSQAEVQATTR
ncbi:hypothetical protein [Rouxiella silvae]|uniref:hypothetical protein n=1 Tax=Rouxiella silvae TaxID=1646373 RepID=UPI0039F05E74